MCCVVHTARGLSNATVTFVGGQVGGTWHTWIDYDRFHELVASGKDFRAEDYMAPTPEWALVGSDERGFDPVEVRHHRRKPPKNVHGC